MIILQNSFFSYGNIYGNGPIFIKINYDDTQKSLAILMDFISTYSRILPMVLPLNIHSRLQLKP